jgi:hypothetical protein
MYFGFMKLNCYYISRACLEVECSKRLVWKLNAQRDLI